MFPLCKRSERLIEVKRRLDGGRRKPVLACGERAMRGAFIGGKGRAMCVSLEEIHKSAREIYKSAKEIHISPKEIHKSMGEICISLSDLYIAVEGMKATRKIKSSSF